MKEALAEDDALKFAEAWKELDKDTQIALWVAPKKGGIWTTKERAQMREYSNQLRHPPPPVPATLED